MASQSVFIQFRYCPLCRLNHKKSKKHIFSKRHQEIVANVLKKLSKKITEAKLKMKPPLVCEITWVESDQTVWCYFCSSDVVKHRRHMTAMGECMISHGGLLEHITRDDHTQNTVKFLKENKLDLKRVPDFILSSSDYLQYLENTDGVCSNFFKKKMEDLKRLATELKSQTVSRLQIFATGCIDQNMSQHQREQLPVQSFSKEPQKYKHGKNQPGDDDERGKKTIQAFGDGLTPIERQNEDDSLGNIYTDALPPWMLPDVEESNSSGVIGPTMEDLEKHRKLEKKRQLPACRVGAKFDHTTDQSDTWLPDFGGVWSHGRRTNSVQQFKRRQSKKGLNSHFSSSTLTSATKPSSPSPAYSNLENKTGAMPWSDGMSRDIVLVDSQEANNISVYPLMPCSTNGVSLINGEQSDLPINNFHPPHANDKFSNISHPQVADHFAVTGQKIVKPYVRKRKLPPNCVSSYNPEYSSAQVSDRTVQPHERYEDSQHYIYHDNNQSKRLPYQTFAAVCGTEAGQFSSYKRARHQPTATHLLSDPAHTDNKTFRLLETPVLNQKK
ncbi:unnamed protein product [Lymnaea stagnalis]|uniref:Coiled-coil domain-containing protein 84 n=1 Tax=Lymnaea stagnalis TaxID=6523 RepID=A0AAV2I280_LYMST